MILFIFIFFIFGDWDITGCRMVAISVAFVVFVAFVLLVVAVDP